MIVRRGSAPLELVLTAPLLVGMVVWVAGLGATGVARTAAVSAARSAAWAAPTACAEPLRLDHPLDDGRVTGRGRRAAAGRWRAGPPVETATAVTAGGAWAADEVPFPERPPHIEPHLPPLADLVHRNPGSFGRLTAEGLAAARRIDPTRAGVTPAADRVGPAVGATAAVPTPAALDRAAVVARGRLAAGFLSHLTAPAR